MLIPRHRSDPKELRGHLRVRLPQWMLDELDSYGNRTEQTETAIMHYLKKKREEQEKSTRH